MGDRRLGLVANMWAVDMLVTVYTELVILKMLGEVNNTLSSN